jgi:hypothetical protein
MTLSTSFRKAFIIRCPTDKNKISAYSMEARSVIDEVE